ncbi:hypothetical protein BDW62DRAFT_67445 [Aspergillus aurantiobrunneus]
MEHQQPCPQPRNPTVRVPGKTPPELSLSGDNTPKHTQRLTDTVSTSSFLLTPSLVEERMLVGNK